jgi:hypothetical protein
MELDYLLATAIFLSVCVYVAVETVGLYEVSGGEVVLYKKEYLTHYNDLKYNFSISKGNLIYNFKVNNITHIMEGWVFKNDSDGRVLINELSKLNSDSFIIAYSPSRDEFIVSNNKKFLKIVGNYNISTTYQREEYYDHDLEIIHPENYTIKHRDFPQTPCTKLFEIPFCIIDRGNLTIKYYGVLGVGK